MYCNKCGAEMPENAKFCSHCGGQQNNKPGTQETPQNINQQKESSNQQVQQQYPQPISQSQPKETTETISQTTKLSQSGEQQQTSEYSRQPVQPVQKAVQQTGQEASQQKSVPVQNNASQQAPPPAAQQYTQQQPQNQHGQQNMQRPNNIPQQPYNPNQGQRPPNYGYNQGHPPYGQPYPKKKGKGCLIAALVMVLVIAALAVVWLLCEDTIKSTLGIQGSISLTTANVTDLKTASKIDETTSMPVTVTDRFSIGTKTFYVTGILRNAPSGTMIKDVWTHIDSNSVFFEGNEIEAANTVPFYFSVELDNGFPEGKYNVKIFVDGKEKGSTDFEVK